MFPVASLFRQRVHFADAARLSGFTAQRQRPRALSWFQLRLKVSYRWLRNFARTHGYHNRRFSGDTFASVRPTVEIVTSYVAVVMVEVMEVRAALTAATEGVEVGVDQGMVNWRTLGGDHSCSQCQRRIGHTSEAQQQRSTQLLVHM